MSSFSDNLRQLREFAQLTQGELAKLAGLNTRTIYTAENGGRVAPATRKAIVRALASLSMVGKTEEEVNAQLMGPLPSPPPPAPAQEEAPSRGPAFPWTEHNVDPNQNPYHRGQGIAVSTFTSAGPDTDYQAGIFSDRYLPSTLIPYEIWRPVAFEVRGNSMEPNFEAGDVLVVAQGLEGDVMTGDYVVVGFHGEEEHTFKQLRIIDEETWELVPLNQVKHVARRVKRSEVAWVFPVVGRWEPIFARRVKRWETGREDE